jgi:hypothetical protein
LAQSSGELLCLSPDYVVAASLDLADFALKTQSHWCDPTLKLTPKS